MFIGWEFMYWRHGTYIGQEKYVKRIITQHNVEHFRPADTPPPVKCILTATSDKDVTLLKDEHDLYQSLNGALPYLVICNRLEISFDVSVLVGHLHAPTKRHFVLAERVV